MVPLQTRTKANLNHLSGHRKLAMNVDGARSNAMVLCNALTVRALH
jgi:hypothetical protein